MFPLRNLLNLLLAALIFWASSPAHAGTLSARFQDRLANLKPGETLPALLRFSDQADLHRFTDGKKSAPALIRSLRDLSQRDTGRLRAVLSGQEYKGRFTPLWIVNAVALDATLSSAQRLSDLLYVASCDEDEAVVAGDVDMDSPTDFIQQGGSNPGWNVSKIGADSVWWQYGLTGEGVLIGSMDGGVDTAHPSLAPKWKGGAHSWFDAINGRPNPYDDLGHGTHTTGTLVGGDGTGPDPNDVGIAYGAKFIAAKMLSSGYSTVSQVVSAAQWMLDPDGDPSTNDFPDVINNSWLSNTRGSTWFYDAAAAWRAAGIIPVFCAANFGPADSSTRSPGDYGNCISVGGTNSVDDRFAATSVGPSPAGPPFPADRRKPDLSAPGEGVVSSLAGGGFGAASGTSMATPHVTGTIALLLEAVPDLSYDEILDILKRTSVDLGASGYDYVFGYGRINALAAVREALRLRVKTSYDERWNLVSMPLVAGNDSVASLFGSPAVPAYGYDSGSGYTAAVTMAMCKGYWVRFPAARSASFSGRVVEDTSFSVTTGWNLIGGISVPVHASSITSEPPGMITGNFFGYAGSYFVSTDINPGRAYWVNVDRSGTIRLSSHPAADASSRLRIIGTAELPPPPPESTVRLSTKVPGEYSLRQNYPNPFNPSTVIFYNLPADSRTTIRIYNTLSQLVATLVDGVVRAGPQEAIWDASNAASGVYYYRLDAVSTARGGGSFTETGKMILMK